jgi:regulator of protease activity HflC (stomatin/prohibitin superfamily)
MIGAFVWANYEMEEGSGVKGAVALILGIVLLVSFIVVPFSFHTVQTGEIAVVKHLGKVKEIKGDGTSYAFWMTNRYQKYDTKVREVTFEDMAYSRDAQQMTLLIKFQYQIMPEKVMDIAKTYGSLDALETRVQAIVIEKTKSALSSYTAMEIIANRSILSPMIEEVVKSSVGKEYYTAVKSISIINIDFSDAFESAVEEKMIAEQKKIKSEYEAEAKIVTAKATAEANQLLETSLTDKILQEMYINKWDGKLPQVVTDGDTVFQIPNLQ